MVTPDNHTDLFKQALISGETDQFSPQDQHTLVIKGILYTITENPTLDNIALLGEAVLNSAYPEIATSCLHALSNLSKSNNQDALETLYTLAIENQIGEAAAIIMEQKGNSIFPWKMSLFTLFYNLKSLPDLPDFINLLTQGYRQSPPATKLRVLKALDVLSLRNLIPILTSIIELDQSSLQPLINLFSAFSKEEKQLVFKLLNEQIASSSPLITEIICSLVILYEDDQALKLALSHQLTPGDPIQKAVFLFLSGQWELYQQLDFNRSLISTAFERSGDEVRKRLLTASRESGINDWLVTLSQRSQSRWLNDMTTGDWLDAIQSCQANLLWPELWKLCLSAPPYWSRQMLQSLASSGWQPLEGADFYQSMLSLSMAATQPLEIHKEKVLFSPGKSITSIAYHSAKSRLAAGTRDQDILFWDVEKDPVSLPSLQGPVALSRVITFDPAGEHLVSANIDNAIRIYKLPEGKLIKTLTGHGNLVRAISLHPDGRTLFSADFDGRIITWNFPFGTEMSRLQVCKGEIYALAVSSNGRILFSSGACGHLHGWDWNKWKEVKNLSTGASITLLAAPQKSPVLAFYGTDHKMTLWNYETEKTLNEFLYSPPSPLFTSMALLSSGKFFLTGTKSAGLILHNLETGDLIASGNVAGDQTTITSLAVTPDDQTCYSSTSDGKIYIWDLSPILSLFIPVKMAPIHQIEIIQEKLKTNLQQNEKNWLKLAQGLYQWHRRFDIQILDNHPISIGEFDIFL